MALVFNNADALANGVLASAANTGGNSGTVLDVGGTGFNMVGNSGSLLNTPTGGSNSGFVLFRNTGGTANSLPWTPTTMWLTGTFVYNVSIPTIGRMMQVVNSGFSLQGGVGVNASDQLTLVRNGSVVAATSTTVLPIGSPFRVEMMVVSHASTGSIVARIYLDPRSAVITETVTATGINTTGGAIVAAIWGFPTTTTTSNTSTLDNLGASDTDWIGPIESRRTSGLMFT